METISFPQLYSLVLHSNGNGPLPQANTFYTAKEDELRMKLDELELKLRSADPKCEHSAQQTLVKKVCPELSCLREYVVLNYTAVVKAVKKGNKNLGQNIHAVQLLAGEPIFCSLGLAKLVTRAEMLTMHAAPAAERKMADYCCPICDEVLSNPIILPCKHRFCFKCIAVATLDDSSTAKLSSDASSKRDANNDEFAIVPPPEKMSHSSFPDIKMVPSSLNRTTNCTLVRGACPVCKKPHVNDESGLRVDPQLDEFIKTHFLHDSMTSSSKQDSLQSRSVSLNNDPHVSMPLSHQATRSSAVQNIPKALVIVVAGCRGDALLAADAPTMAAYVRGKGCFSFHMQHTFNRCSRMPSGAIMPLLTGSEGTSDLETAKSEVDGGKKIKNVFSRLTEVRSWVRVAAAVGGAPDLASALAADATELIAPPDANDEAAAVAAARALSADMGPDVLCLHLNDIQDAGALHGYGPHITGYREAVESADAHITHVLQSLQQRQAAHPREEWLVIITSPAGGTTRADMPAAMQGHFDAADWCGGGGRQLRAAGVTGFGSLPQHATGWVLIDTPAGSGFGGSQTSDGRACGELLPPPCDVDVAPTLLEHFGVAPRREWKLDGAHLLAARRTDAALSQTSDMSTGTSHSLASTKSGTKIDGLQSNLPSATNQTLHVPTSSMVATKKPSSDMDSDDSPCGGSKEIVHGDKQVVNVTELSKLPSPGPFASHLPGLFEPTGCAVVGHRGFGMNRCSGRGIRENTVASFIAAHGSGAGWCEFDVQVTADGIPVLWHDDVLLIRHGFEPIQSFSIRELDLSELKALSRAAIATAAAAAARVPAAMAAAAGADSTDEFCDLKAPCSGSGGVDEDDDDDDEDKPSADIPVVFYRKFPVGYGSRLAPEPEPWVMDVEDEIPTLEELMKHAPPELGFSMELKFDEANPCATPRLVAELRAILAVCRAHPTRRILFSSFDPDAASLMRALQGLYPVMLISDCEPHHADPRRCSVAAAKKWALDVGLCGLVLNVKVLAKGPEVADEVRSSGLLLGTYGKENDCKPLASKQVEWGMCLVCTDNVAGLVGMFNAPVVQQVNTVPALAPLMSPSLDAATAARKLGEMELEAVMRAPWYQLSEDGKKCKNGKAGVPLLTPLRSGRRQLRESGSCGIGRVGTAEALSALATEAAGLAAATAEKSLGLSNKGSLPVVSSLTRVTKSTLATPPPQPSGVVAKGQDNSWAMFPAHIRGSSHHQQNGNLQVATRSVWRSGVQAQAAS